MASSSTGTSFPKQKLTKGLKTKEWEKSCINAALHLTLLYDNTRRSPRYKKLRNYNLYNGKFDKDDLAYVCNPLGIVEDGYEFPANMQYYPIATPIFDLLFGEETKRNFSYVVRSVNADSISAKEEKRIEAIRDALKMKVMMAIEQDKAMQEGQGQPQQGQQQEDPLKEIEHYFKYNYSDLRESVAGKILKYLEHDLKLSEKFQKGWEDALLAGEEIYKAEKIANEPQLRRCNPLEIYAILPHNSDHLDNAEVIVEETYMSVSEIIDCYHDELTPAEIDKLESNIDNTSSFGNNHLVAPDDRVIGIRSGTNSAFGNSTIFDSDGNIRVCHVTWKSRRKVANVTYIDELDIEQTKQVDESYKKQEGEKLSWYWINEYREGTKIGETIYVNMGVKDTQFRRMDNPSKCSSGYVGTVYNATNSQSISLMDRLVPWIYMYIVTWYRTELLMAANQGKIALVDISLIPDGWEVEKWMYYATAMKFGFVDSFNEGKKGQATGKLAGNYNQNKVLDLETGQAIQGHIAILDYIETKIQELSGVTKQRMGSISASEKVGNTDKAVVQSSHITEKWFKMHNWTKQRVYSTLLEVAKECWAGKNKKFQFVADDLATTFFSLDPKDGITDSEYGVFITDAANDLEAMDAIKQLAHAALQNDKIMLSSIAEIYSKNALSDVKVILQEAEEKIRVREDQAAQQANETNSSIAQMEDQAKKAELEKDYYKIDKDNQTKIDVAEINSFKNQMDQDSNDNGVPDQLEIAKLKANVDNNNRKLDLEEKKLNQKGEELKQKKEIEEKKIKASANKATKK